MKKIITLSALIIAFFISGCEEKNTREWYINHHDELIKKYTECLLDDTWNIQECQNARDALRHERDKPDIDKGLKEAYKKLDAKIEAQQIPDLNNLKN
ncbi:EexN family lipoprotein [Salmonella enterica]|nr:EexN family lipoprotein [Salmonella enterica]ELX2844841.1 EexN family lipoprotein [Salmonella enterica]